MDFLWHMNHWKTYVLRYFIRKFCIYYRELKKKNIQPVVVIKTVFITFLYGKIPRNSYKLYMYNFKSFFSISQWWYDIFKRDTMIFPLKTNDKSYLRVHV